MSASIRTGTEEADTQHLELDSSGDQLGGTSLRLRIIGFCSAHPVLIVFILALVARIAVALGIEVMLEGSVSLDDSTYSQMAADAATGNTATWDSYIGGLWIDTLVFLQPLTWTYEIFGIDSFAGQIFVAILGASTAAAVAGLALRHSRASHAIAAGLIVALLPSQVLWSSVTLKDAAVWLVLSSLALTIALANSSSGVKLVVLVFGSGVLLGMLGFLRLHTLVVAAWALLIASFFGNRESRFLRIVSAALFWLSIPWFVGIGPAGVTLITDSEYSLQERRELNAVGASTAIVEPGTPQTAILDLTLQEQQVLALLEAAGDPEPGEQATKDVAQELGLTEEEVDRIRRTAEEKVATALEADRPVFGGSETGTSLDPNLTHLPKGISVMLLEPFPLPWEGSLALRLAKVETLIWYPILMLAALGIPAALRKRRTMAFPLLAGVAVMVVYALTDGNVGTAYRHRGEFVWVIALLAGLGLVRFRREQERPISSSN